MEAPSHCFGGAWCNWWWWVGRLTAHLVAASDRVTSGHWPPLWDRRRWELGGLVCWLTIWWHNCGWPNKGRYPMQEQSWPLGDFCKPWIDHFDQIELEPHISPGLAPDKRIHNFPLKPVCNIRAPLLLKVGWIWPTFFSPGIMVKLYRAESVLPSFTAKKEKSRKLACVWAYTVIQTYWNQLIN